MTYLYFEEERFFSLKQPVKCSCLVLTAVCALSQYGELIHVEQKFLIFLEQWSGIIVLSQFWQDCGMHSLICLSTARITCLWLPGRKLGRFALFWYNGLIYLSFCCVYPITVSWFP